MVADDLAGLIGTEGRDPGAIDPARVLGSVRGDGRRQIYVDAGTYPIARWGAERAHCGGASVRTFRHHDPRALRRAVSDGRRRSPPGHPHRRAVPGLRADSADRRLSRRRPPRRRVGGHRRHPGPRASSGRPRRGTRTAAAAAAPHAGPQVDEPPPDRRGVAGEGIRRAGCRRGRQPCRWCGGTRPEARPGCTAVRRPTRTSAPRPTRCAATPAGGFAAQASRAPGDPVPRLARPRSACPVTPGLFPVQTMRTRQRDAPGACTGISPTSGYRPVLHTAAVRAGPRAFVHHHRGAPGRRYRPGGPRHQHRPARRERPWGKAMAAGDSQMIIDSHCHAGQGDGLTGPWDTSAPLGAYLRRARRGRDRAGRSCSPRSTPITAARTRSRPHRGQPPRPGSPGTPWWTQAGTGDGSVTSWRRR